MSHVIGTTSSKCGDGVIEIKFFSLQLCLLIFACAPTLAAEREESDRVLSLLKAHCSDCHGTTNPEGGLCLDDLRVDFADESLVDTWQRIHEQISLGVMPPEDSSQLSVMEVEYLTGWIIRQLRKVGHVPNVWHKLKSPHFGNYVSHEKLFDGSHTGPGSSPPRLWRVSPYVYDEFLNGFGQHLREVTAIHQPFALDNTRGEIADFSAQQFAGEATLHGDVLTFDVPESATLVSRFCSQPVSAFFFSHAICS